MWTTLTTSSSPPKCSAPEADTASRSRTRCRRSRADKVHPDCSTDDTVHPLDRGLRGGSRALRCARGPSAELDGSDLSSSRRSARAMNGGAALEVVVGLSDASDEIRVAALLAQPHRGWAARRGALGPIRAGKCDSRVIDTSDPEVAGSPCCCSRLRGESPFCGCILRRWHDR